MRSAETEGRSAAGTTTTAPDGASAGATDVASPREALEALAGCRTPYLVGVRHHSAALAAAVPAMLAAAAPEILFVELPAEFAPWLPHLADPATVPPVALAGHGPGGLVFLPFAEFSPELAALRWAFSEGVPVVAFDLPVGARTGGGDESGAGQGTGNEDTSGASAGGQGSSGTAAEPARPEGTLERALRNQVAGRAEDDLWDRLVEAAAPGGTPEELRRAALLVGWALRTDAADAGRLDPHDLRREARMRALLAEHPGRRTAAVVGAFHGSALLPDAPGHAVPAPGAVGMSEVTTSLVPYTYPLLDERSGYPAGIRDPEWQSGVFRAAGDLDLLDELLLSTAVRICAAVRASGHPCGPPDAREVVRHARDLAALRGLPAAGRGELLEAVRTVLTQGRLLGRGRVVAKALEDVLVGTRHGRLAPGTPRSGLGPSVEALLGELGLPSPDFPDRRELRLDPHRSPLDRRRELALRQLAVCRVPYGEPAEVSGAGGTAAIGTRWTVEWTPTTAAMLDAVAVHGPGLSEAAEGLLRQRARHERSSGGPTAAQVLAGLADAAHCGLPVPAGERLADTAHVLPSVASLAELLAAVDVLERLAAGHFPGLPDAWEKEAVAAARSELNAAGVRALDGLAWSEDPADARALAELAERAAGEGTRLRLSATLERLAAEGTAMIRGAAGTTRVLLAESSPAAFGVQLAARTHDASTPELRTDLASFLTGALTAAGPLMEAGALLAPLIDRIESLPDRSFLTRLPALRAGFNALSPAARGRLLATVRTAARVSSSSTPEATLLHHATADLAAREALAALGLLPPTPGALAPERSAGARSGGGSDAVSHVPGTIWQLARTSDGLPLVARASDGASPDKEAAAGGGVGLDSRAGREQGAEPEADPGVGPDAGGAASPEPAQDAGLNSVGGTDPVLHDHVLDGDRKGSGRSSAGADAAPVGIPADVRWQLVLGRSENRAGQAGRIADALDDLYGSGRGEGAQEGTAGGDGRSYPDVRLWAEELAALFGAGVREEVLAAAAAAGRVDAALEMDPESARPSVELLRTVLSYAGSLSEGQLGKLRPLVARVVEELTRSLANRMRPALTGLAHPRPTRRPGGPLDLGRTVRANLATARRDPVGGGLTVLPEQPVFRTRARKSADWRIVLVVDVSGSMEASTIWAAVTAAVLAGVPALTTHFVAFSTEVMDFSGQVDDPLGLLLEVRVGGGTDIARGLRHARSMVSVPSRTLVVLVSDFEEGGPVGPLLGEVRALVDAGCHVLGCASLDDAGRPRYSVAVAGQLVSAGMPVAALAPLELARWVGERVSGTPGAAR